MVVPVVAVVAKEISHHMGLLPQMQTMVKCNPRKNESKFLSNLKVKKIITISLTINSRGYHLKDLSRWPGPIRSGVGDSLCCVVYNITNSFMIKRTMHRTRDSHEWFQHN